MIKLSWLLGVSRNVVCKGFQSRCESFELNAFEIHYQIMPMNSTIQCFTKIVLSEQPWKRLARLDSQLYWTNYLKSSRLLDFSIVSIDLFILIVFLYWIRRSFQFAFFRLFNFKTYMVLRRQGQFLLETNQIYWAKYSLRLMKPLVLEVVVVFRQSPYCEHFVWKKYGWCVSVVWCLLN